LKDQLTVERLKLINSWKTDEQLKDRLTVERQITDERQITVERPINSWKAD